MERTCQMSPYVIFICLLSCVISVEGTGNTSKEHSGIEVAGFNFEKLQNYIIVIIFIMCVIIVKMVYHHLDLIASYIPESCILIALGVIFGAILRYTNASALKYLNLTPDFFFLVLLPPIVLESAYSLYNRTFGDILGTVLLFAVLGTILNFLIIGFSLWGLSFGAMGSPAVDFSLKSCLLFSSMIVAVDPVAVLAIFQDIGVDLGLYYMVFGESLLNDAVTVVLYGIMQAFVKQETVAADQIGLGIASFFTISLGGLLVGIIVGILCCFITRFTRSSRMLEPAIVLTMGYLAYIMGDLFEWSGIISMIGCGLIQAAYGFHNISKKSLIVVKRTCKMVASLSEAMIFLFLGSELMTEHLVWHTGFHLWSLVICLVSRALVVLCLCAVLNWIRVDGTRISLTEQFILIYGGLRGAVAFSLCVLIDAKFLGTDGKNVRNIFLTSTLFIILFTVVIMGLTIKPLVKLLHIRLQASSELSLFQELNKSIFDQMLCGMEEIAGEKGRNALRDFFTRLDDRYIRKVLQRDPEANDFLKVYEKVCLKLHYASLHPDQSEHYLDRLTTNLKQSDDRLHHSESSATLASQTDLELDHDDERSYMRARRQTATNPSNDAQVVQVLRQRRKTSAFLGRRPVEFHDQLSDAIRSRKIAVRRASRYSRAVWDPSEHPANNPELQVPPNHPAARDLNDITMDEVKEEDRGEHRKRKTMVQFVVDGDETTPL